MLKLKKQIQEFIVLYRNKKIHWIYKILPALVIVYAIFPMDLIPDFIPVMGLLDDFVIVPLGFFLTIKEFMKALKMDFWTKRNKN